MDNEMKFLVGLGINEQDVSILTMLRDNDIETSRIITDITTIHFLIGMIKGKHYHTINDSMIKSHVKTLEYMEMSFIDELQHLIKHTKEDEDE